MSLLSWIGKVISLRDGRFWSTFYGGDNWAGKTVTIENSLNLSAWWSCIQLHAGITGTLPLKFYERKANDDRAQVREHPVAQLIGSSPNIDQTTHEFWGGLAACLKGLGNAYAEKRYVGSSLAALEPLPFDTVPDRFHRPGELWYRYRDRLTGAIQWLPQDKVFHIRGFTFGKSDVGLSPLDAARQALSITLATEESAGKTFSQGLRMSGFFSGPRLQPEQRAEFKKTFIDPITGNDASSHYGILENGFDFKPINIPPKDAEMLLSRRFNVEEICRFMGTPPILAGHAGDGQTMWGTGVEGIINAWRTMGLDSHLTGIEKACNKWLLTPEERVRFYCEFDRDAMLSADLNAKGEFLSKMIQNGQMTPNEGRRKANRSALEGGDILLVNSTLIPLTDAGRLGGRIPRPIGVDAPPVPAEGQVP
jgi:HK97 family phage portal protein